MKYFALSLALVGAISAAEFRTGQAARAVIGQETFTRQKAGASAQLLGAVSGVAYANDTLIVSDSSRIPAFPQNQRVLVYRGLSQQIHASKVGPPAPAVLDWLVGIRERRSKRLWRGYAQQLVYFGLPTTALAQLQYVRAFCGASKEPCLAPADATLLKQLDDRKLWRDPSHLTRRGAIIYSRWLAQGLASLNVLQK